MPLAPVHEASPSPSRWDRAGIVASGLCLFHCIALPFLVVAIPGIGLAWLADESIHKWLIAILILLAAPAFASGYRAHRLSRVPAAGIAALVLLTFAAYGAPGLLGDPWERRLTIAGSAFLIAAHGFNLWLTRTCRARLR